MVALEGLLPVRCVCVCVCVAWRVGTGPHKGLVMVMMMMMMMMILCLLLQNCLLRDAVCEDVLADAAQFHAYCWGALRRVRGGGSITRQEGMDGGRGDRGEEKAPAGIANRSEQSRAGRLLLLLLLPRLLPSFKKNVICRISPVFQPFFLPFFCRSACFKK